MRNATREIPILIVTAIDPVATGLVASLSHPGINVTGLTQDVGAALYSKRLDLLCQMVPGLCRVAIRYNPDNPSFEPVFKQFDSDYAKPGLKSVRAPVRKREDIAAAFTKLKSAGVQGLIVTANSTNLAWRDTIIENALKHHVPTIYTSTLFAESGGLISYAANRADMYRRAAAFSRQGFKGSEAGRFADRAACKVRTHRQSESRQDARSQDSEFGFAAGDQGDRIMHTNDAKHRSARRIGM